VVVNIPNVSSNENAIIIAFRGTEPTSLVQWMTDASTNFNKFRPASDLCDDKSKYSPYIENVEIHAGFYAALGLDQLNPGEKINHQEVTLNSAMFRQIFHALEEFKQQSKKTKIFVTGHSLGAALASLFSYILLLCDYESSIAGVYTYGQPLVGNLEYAKLMNQKLGHRVHRWVNHSDIVTRIPIIALPSVAGTLASTPYSQALEIAINEKRKQHPNASYQDLLQKVHYYHHGLRFKIDRLENLENNEKLDQGPILGFEDRLDLLHISYTAEKTFTSLTQQNVTRTVAWIGAPPEINDHFPGEYATKIKKIVNSNKH